MDWPARTGMEPLFRLKTSWKPGLMMALARSLCALRSSIFQLEQNERVHVEGERIGRAGRCGA